MKKILPLIFIFLLIGAGYFLLTNRTEKKPIQEKLKEVVNQTKEEVAQGIKEMVYKNVSLKCIYETPEGTKVTAYIKGTDKIRSIMEGKDKKNEVIFFKGKMYAWDNKTKQGMIMTINQIKPQKNEKTVIEDPKKYIEELEKIKAKCSQENFSDAIFQPPADIKFQDLDKIQEMMEKGNFQTPAGDN